MMHRKWFWCPTVGETHVLDLAMEKERFTTISFSGRYMLLLILPSFLLIRLCGEVFYHLLIVFVLRIWCYWGRMVIDGLVG